MIMKTIPQYRSVTKCCYKPNLTTCQQQVCVGGEESLQPQPEEPTSFINKIAQQPGDLIRWVKTWYSYTNEEIYANMDLVSQIVQSDTKKTKDQLHFYKFGDICIYGFIQSNILVLSKRSSWKLSQKHLYFAHFVFEICSGMLTSFQLIQSSKSSRLIKNIFLSFVQEHREDIFVLLRDKYDGTWPKEK